MDRKTQYCQGVSFYSGVEVHACNPSYSGGGRRIAGLRPAREKLDPI
jgi:hypothetical protein